MEEKIFSLIIFKLLKALSTYNTFPYQLKACHLPLYWPVVPQPVVPKLRHVALAKDEPKVIPKLDLWAPKGSSNALVCIVSDQKLPIHLMGWQVLCYWPLLVREEAKINSKFTLKVTFSSLKGATYRYTSWQKTINTMHRYYKAITIQSSQ